MELAQQPREKLERDKQEVEREIAANNREWRVLLDMELANYPDMIVSDKKRELTSERESLFRRESRIDIELEALPHIDPQEVEVALSELEKPFRMYKHWWLTNTSSHGLGAHVYRKPVTRTSPPFTGDTTKTEFPYQG